MAAGGYVLAVGDGVLGARRGQLTVGARTQSSDHHAEHEK
jgi:hypothetical protein